MEKFNMKDYAGKKFEDAYKEYIDKNFRDGMTAEEFFDAFVGDFFFWDMCRGNWEPTFHYEWSKPVKGYRVLRGRADDGERIGLGRTAFSCIEFLI